MLRRYLLILPAMVVACSQRGEVSFAIPGEIFRYTAVGRSAPLDSVVLGQHWKNASKYGAHEGDTVTVLPSGQFAGAEAIAVRRSTTGIVTDIEFSYNARRDIPALVADYRSSLGKPVSITIDTVSGSTRTTTRWCDESTAFVIATVVPVLKDSVGAVAFLRDRTSTLATRGLTRSCS